MGWTCRSQNWLTLDPYYLDHHTSLHPRVHAILKLEYRDTCNIGLQRTSILSYLRTSELNHLLLQFFFVPMTKFEAVFALSTIDLQVNLLMTVV